MDINKQVNDKSSVFNRLSEKYLAYDDAVNATQLDELQSLAAVFRQDAAHCLDDNRTLRIGIIGQIKRGKSSFLNSLLFDGKDVLPKAATPMTAALTRISFQEQPAATVEFYSQAEWEQVQSTAATASEKQANYERELNAFNQARAGGRGFAMRPLAVAPSDEESASQELVNMIASNGVDVDDYLGQSHSIHGVNSNRDLVDQLNQFVGANGQFTPIVKSTELRLNIPGLQDIEVVDTPGVNDPIISRGRKTQEFIGQCDVIFFLSNCSQFLDVHDMGLLAQNIPNKGIEEIVLVGSVFDNALDDEYHSYPNIGAALSGLTSKLNRHAQDSVASVCARELSQQSQADCADVSSQSHLMQTLQNALPPIFISARCLDLARKLANDNLVLSDEEQLSLDKLNEMYPGFSVTPEILRQLGNFGKIEHKLDSVRDKKTQIMAERFGNLLRGSSREVLQKLSSMREDVSHKQKLLCDGDLEALTQKQNALIKRIEAGEFKVKTVFEKYRIQAEKALLKASNEIEQASLGAKQVQSQTGSRQESYETSHQVSTSKWYNPSSWGSSRTEYTTHYRTVNYTYADVQEAVARLEDFVMATSRKLFAASEQAINLGLFRNDIKSAVKDMFDFSDDDFDPEMVLLPLDNAVARITIPAINLDLARHIDTIRQQFTSSQVEGDQIAQLRNE
ncbi:dynamin family protein [Shewanella colwelliana]|uniref:dynamin family protein n=1 Tax=Shewanella colwelliana TaxID=23 RepID=UPI0004B6F5CC|nr:dynamin family protein [Shewanella colwelliana]